MFKRLWHKLKYRNKKDNSVSLQDIVDDCCVYDCPHSRARKQIDSSSKTKVESILEGVIEKHHGLYASIMYKRSR